MSSGIPEVVAEVTEMFKQRIKNYQEIYKDAPDEYIPKEATFEFKPAVYYKDQAMVKENIEQWQNDPDDEAKELIHRYENEQKIVLDAQLDDGHFVSLSITNYASDQKHWSRLSFSKSKTLNHLFEPSFERDNREESTLTEEEARAKTHTFLSKIGIKNIVMTRFFPYEVRVDKMGQPIDIPKCYGYAATFQREYEGIPTINDQGYLPGDQQYGPWYSYEFIEIGIMGDEITSFYWTNPTKVETIENENVAIRPLDEIVELFMKQMSLEYTLEKLSRDAPDNPGHDERMAKLTAGEIMITDIELCMVRVDVRNAPGKYRMIPVWKFYGGEKLSSKDYESEEFMSPCSRFCDFNYLTINAIDGSVINQRG